MHGMTALQQRLVVSGKRLVLPLAVRMVLLPCNRGAARRAEGYVIQRFVFPQYSLSLVFHPRTPSPLRGTSPISGEEYLALFFSFSFLILSGGRTLCMSQLFPSVWSCSSNIGELSALSPGWSCSPNIGELPALSPGWSCSPDIGELPAGLRGTFPIFNTQYLVYLSSFSFSVSFNACLMSFKTKSGYSNICLFSKRRRRMPCLRHKYSSRHWS